MIRSQACLLLLSSDFLLEYLGRDSVLGHHLLSLGLLVGFALLLQQGALHFSALIFNFLSLFDNHISSTDIGVSLLQADYRVEFHSIILLVQVHAVGEHLLHISNFDGQIGGQVLAVYFNAAGVGVQVTPHPHLLDQIMECATSLEMQTLVFLDGQDGDAEEVGLAHNIALEFHIVGKLILGAIVNMLAGDSDFFLSHGVADVPWADPLVHISSHLKGRFPRPDTVDVGVVFTALNHSRDS